MKFLNKIPQSTRARIDGYINLCFGANEELYTYMIGKIATTLAVLYDDGVLTMSERASASSFYRGLADEEYRKDEKNETTY